MVVPKNLTVTFDTCTQEILGSNLNRDYHRSVQTIPTDHITDVINSITLYCHAFMGMTNNMGFGFVDHSLYNHS
jgi:hypothetical protein